MVYIPKSKQYRMLSQKQIVSRLLEHAQFYPRILKELAKVISELFMFISEDSQCSHKMENRTEYLRLKKKKGRKQEREKAKENR